MKFNLEPDTPRIQAEWNSKCPACGDTIHEGDWIVKDEDDEWIHEDCKD